MYSITKFHWDGKVPNNTFNTTNGEVLQYETFKELADSFNSVKQGTKFEEYWVRGALEPLKRKDANLATSNLLIIDGDSSSGKFPGAPPIPELEACLQELGLEYCIYTSHSHTSEKTKFRCVIPVEDMTHKEQLKNTMMHLVQTLNVMDYMIDYVKEMGTWSQPWFYATRADASDDLFYWSYHSGEPLELNHAAPEKADTPDGAISEVMSWQEHIDQIKLGEFHQHLLPLTMGLARDGVDQAMNLAFATSAMQSVPYEMQDERWDSRMKDLPRIVKGAYAKAEEEGKIDDYGLADTEANPDAFPWPPGLLGEFAQYAYDSALIQHRDLSVVNAIITAGVACARGFNVDYHDGIALNTYFTVIANTGTGKDELRRFPKRILLACNELGKASSFIGPNSFTGPPGLARAFETARSRLCVLSEAGLLLQATSGNPTGLMAMVLDWYNKSNSIGMTGELAYSKSDDSIPSMKAVCLTLVSESTPDVLQKSYSDIGALTSGLIPRQTIVSIYGDKPYANDNVPPIPPVIFNKMKHLCDKGSMLQNTDDFDVHLIGWKDRNQAVGYHREMIDLENALRETDPRKSIIASRIFVKVCKYAGIATVFNKDKDDKNSLTIGKEEWEWAKKVGQWELDTVDEIFKGSSFDSDLDDCAMLDMGKFILKRMNESNKPDSWMTRLDQRDKWLPETSIKQGLRNNTRVRALARNGKTGMEEIIGYMLRQQYFKKIEDKRGKRSIFQVTQKFYDSLKATRGI